MRFCKISIYSLIPHDLCDCYFLAIHIEWKLIKSQKIGKILLTWVTMCKSCPNNVSIFLFISNMGFVPLECLKRTMMRDTKLYPIHGKYSSNGKHRKLENLLGYAKLEWMQYWVKTCALINVNIFIDTFIWIWSYIIYGLTIINYLIHK